jgi:hypothetical protein
VSECTGGLSWYKNVLDVLVHCTLLYALRTSDYAFTRLYALSTSGYISYSESESESYTLFALNTCKHMPFSLDMTSHSSAQHFLAVPPLLQLTIMSGKEHLLEMIEKDAQKHIELLQSLIRAASPNPPGDTREAIEVVCRYLDSHGIPNKLIAPKAESPNLVSVIHGGG